MPSSSSARPILNYHARKLQRMLKKLREQNRLTQAEAGERAHIETKKLGRLERRQLPTYHELVILLDAYGVPSCDYGPYVEQWELASKRPWWWEFDGEDVRCARMEDEASRKIEFQLGRIPTLLQTEAYAGMTTANRNTVAFRRRQQERLTAEPRLEFHALIHESVLRQGVDREQLARLAEVAELPNVTIQVVAHTGLAGSVSLLSFDDPDEPDCAFAESVFGLVESQDPEQTGKVRRALCDVTRRAASPAESLALIRALW
ncbi:hypothetical protein ALI144C_06375 [Actinosynnema sp. ALI-1.44]|nr:hypothetical protein ALI144C_06375 [Actinosynnema sp. ALI-1.44]